MTFEVYNINDNTWYDLAAYWSYGNFESTDNDIDGQNAGRNQNGTMIRDYLATKMKWNFVSIPVSMAVAQNLLEAVRETTFRVRTDVVTGSMRQFICYSNNRVLTHLISRSNGEELYKVAFPIIEM